MSTAAILGLSAIVTIGFLCQEVLAGEIPAKREASPVDRNGWAAFGSESKRLIWIRSGAFRAIAGAGSARTERLDH
jgi:hypothetical protein